MDTYEKVIARTIYMARVGSHAYGTNIEGSDVDYKGVCIETKEYFLGFAKQFEQLERKEPDTVVMSLRKFCDLAADCNPNIIEVLNVHEGDVMWSSPWGDELRERAVLFLSKKARFTFAGYAHAQLKRIKTRRSWLLNPPKEKPTRAQFGLGETTKVSKSELGAFEAMAGDVELPADVLSLFLRERQYQAALTTWNQYENWKAKRNDARAALEAQYGYDTKHAMHLVRLMRMCREILSRGEVIVKRPDAEELLAIRRGEWSYDRVVEHAEAIEAECEDLYKTSPLPHHADRNALSDFVVDMTERYLRSV